MIHFTQFYSISSRQPSCPQNWRTNDKGLSTILLTMSILFIVCQSLKLIPDVYELCVCHLTMDKIGHHCTMDWWVSELNQENKKEKNSSLRIFSYLQYIWTFWETTPHCASYYLTIVIPILKFGKDIFICDLFIIRETTDKWKNTQINSSSNNFII